MMNASDESIYLEDELGPKYLPLAQLLPITVVYVVIFVTGIVGNVATCIVIKRNPSMQTTTNYYLFNLAVSDLLFLIFGLPSELSEFWQQYPWRLGSFMCKLRAYVSETSTYVSVLTITAFSLERYLAICHPFRRYSNGMKRPVRFILLSWLVAFGCSVPFYVYMNVNYIEYPAGSGRYSSESAICAMLSDSMPEFPLYEVSCTVFFLLPMVFIAVLYVRMGLRIQSSTLEHNVEGSVHGETSQAQSRKIIRMLSAVVITFFICWVPFHAQRLLYVHQVSTFRDINQWLYPLAGSLYYFSTTVNPILYNVMSVKYRNAFKETLCRSPSSLPIARVDLSSMSESSMFYGPGSRRGSQVLRGRSIKCNSSDRTGNVSRATCQLQSQTSPNEPSKTTKLRVAEPSDSPTGDPTVDKITAKSLLAAPNNGRKRYQTSGRDEAFWNETCI
ncbi:neuropeptides capa receptor [Andrena cerasifolii]|uniref:neuropeptides capa receptor n=1 Tax=Andrena cerasifolii TaxID=2819439 RepID=UPI004037AE4E